MDKKSYNSIPSSTTPMSGSGGGGGGGGSSELNFKLTLEGLQKEVKSLKTKLDNCERENKDLKKSIYDLTIRYDMVSHQLGKGTQKPFNIDAVFGAPQTPEVNSNGTDGHSSIVSIQSPPPTLTSNVSDERLLLTSTQQRNSNKKMDERHFFYKFTLKGHNASVYTVDFSPCGKMLASGSFDKTVKVWDVFNQREMATFNEHTVNVSVLQWNNNSTEILSGSYDKTVKLWDLNSNKLISSYNTSGFILDVKFSPIDNNIFFAGNTQNHVIGFDKRTPNSIIVLENDALINSLYVFKDGQHILTGDSLGKLKVWDSRKGNKINFPESFHYDGCVDGLAGSFSNSANNALVDGSPFEIGPENRPISGITMSSRSGGGSAVGGEDDGRFLAVNSYDNVIRVYDRSKVSIVSHPYSLAPMSLIHSLTGHKNKNWPIKSSIYVGKDYNQDSVVKRTLGVGKSMNDGSKSIIDDDDDDDDDEQPDINQSVLLATGSADYNAYIYDIGFGKQSGKVLQKLEGHTDRVYSVKFHPSEPILASCSADNTIRFWTPKKKIFNN
ncbi:hypothetical protein ACTFIZ_003560 [Dictyostelium cf. discoideum]